MILSKKVAVYYSLNVKECEIVSLIEDPKHLLRPVEEVGSLALAHPMKGKYFLGYDLFYRGLKLAHYILDDGLLERSLGLRILSFYFEGLLLLNN